jgi:putative FmdB family regulatory protein
MPTYEYSCKKCGHEFEAVHSMAAPSLKVCPKDDCGLKKWGRGAVAKKIGAGAGLIFKGSGFYITDYRSEGYKSAAKKESTDSKPAAKTETKSEAKPEAKPAKKADKK